MLRMGTYPWSLKRRILSRYGHLSNDDALNAVQRMIGAETKTLCLIHLSQTNNAESIVKDMATRLMTRLGAQLELGIAKQSEPTGRFEVTCHLVFFAFMNAVITVSLKPSVLDPQGKAIQHSLSSLGFGGVEDVRVGKLFKLTLADSGQSRENVESQIRQMCERLLANTVIETFSYTLEE